MMIRMIMLLLLSLSTVYANYDDIEDLCKSSFSAYYIKLDSDGLKLFTTHYDRIFRSFNKMGLALTDQRMVLNLSAEMATFDYAINDILIRIRIIPSEHIAALYIFNCKDAKMTAKVYEFLKDYFKPKAIVVNLVTHPA